MSKTSLYFQFVLLLCVLAFSHITVFTNAQTPKKIKEFRVGKLDNVSVDRLGDLFIIFKNGSIKKYDANGKVLASLKKGKIPTLIEPWFHPMIFSYFRDEQKYVYSDHNLQLVQQEKIDPSIAINPFLICPTNDNKLLILDQADWSIKKFNPKTSKVISEFNIDTIGLSKKPQFTYLREYQNLIFLLDENSGILIFSNLGKKINHIKCKVRNFGFYGEELFYLLGDKVILFDLYTEAIREAKVEQGKFVIITDERIFLIKENNRISFYEFLAEITEEKPKIE
jgi:hypothetical protein